MSFFNDADKQEIEKCIDAVHETFMKDIVIYLDKKTLSATMDVSYNHVYRRNKGGKKTRIREIQKIEGKARIMHEDPRKDTWSDPSVESQLRLDIPANSVRLRVDKETYKVLLDAKRVVITEEGRKYALSSDFRPHGVFNNRYYDFYLQAIDQEQ